MSGRCLNAILLATTGLGRMSAVATDAPTNVSDDDDDHDHHDDDAKANSFISVFYIIMSIFICFGNSSTLIAIGRNRRLRTIPNIYIGSLAVADLTVGLMLLVQGISELDFSQHLRDNEEAFCLVRMCMLFISVAASLLSYLLVTCDRYIYILHSLKYIQLVTKQRSLIIVFGAWGLACVYGTVPGYTSRYTHAEGCTPTHVFSEEYMIIVHPVFFLSLGGITLWLYLRIVLTALEQQRRIRDQEVGVSSETRHSKMSQQTWKVVKILMLVFGCFFICWCPLLILAFLEYTIHVNHLSLSIAGLVAVMNSGANFVVLAAMKREFRAEFKRILCFCCWELGCCCDKMKGSNVGVSTVDTSHWGSSH